VRKWFVYFFVANITSLEKMAPQGYVGTKWECKCTREALGFARKKNEEL